LHRSHVSCLVLALRSWEHCWTRWTLHAFTSACYCCTIHSFGSGFCPFCARYFDRTRRGPRGLLTRAYHARCVGHAFAHRTTRFHWKDLLDISRPVALDLTHLTGLTPRYVYHMRHFIAHSSTLCCSFLPHVPVLYTACFVLCMDTLFRHLLDMNLVLHVSFQSLFTATGHLLSFHFSFLPSATAYIFTLCLFL